MAGFDAHTHIFPPSQARSREALAARDRGFGAIYADPKARMASGPELAGALEAAGMDGALAAGFAFAAEREIAEQNEYLLGYAAESGGRVLAAATVNPSLRGWRASLERARAAGAVAAGELRPRDQGWDPLGADGRELCAAAEELGMALLWHVSEPLGHAYRGKAGGIAPHELLLLAAAFPEVPMIGAHLGGGAAWHLLMPEVREKARSVYFDTAAAFLLYDEESIPRLVDLAGDGRVLFGSDFPLQSPAKQAARIRALLPPAAAEAVGGGNAINLFRQLASA